MAIDRHTRNRQIGAVLMRARRRAKKTRIEVAEAVGIPRHRYSDIERGRTFVGAVELEDLVRYLEIPLQEVWPSERVAGDSRTIMVFAQPGESVQVVVALAPEGANLTSINSSSSSS